MVGGAGSDFADGGNAAEEFVERFEVLAELGMEFGEARGAEEFAGCVVMALLQRAAEFEGGLAFSFAGGTSHGQQRVGDLSHGTDHDHGLLVEASLDDRSDAVDGFGVFDGGAAEFHDDHSAGLEWNDRPSEWRRRAEAGRLRHTSASLSAGSRQDAGATFLAPVFGFIPGIPWLSGVRRLIGLHRRHRGSCCAIAP